ncbi:MAG: M23 family metallopeptidase [Acidobacteria bacterium]|nr:M23 family metallopeptidase [Acidobacteriota bacterium]
MRALGRFLLFVIVLTAAVGGVAYYLAGRQPGPTIEIRAPEKLVGQTASLDVAVETPGGQLSSLTAVVEQKDLRETVFSLDVAGATGEIKQESPDRLLIARPMGKKALPALAAGPARVTVTASRPVLFGLRQVSTVATRDLEVRLTPPRVGIVSLHHFVNHGGAEFVVYRVSPGDSASGVRVGEAAFRGFPGSSVGLSDPELHVGFFALAHDQELNAPVRAFARDAAGNEASTPIDHRVFPRPFAKSRIDIDQSFLERIVPAIASNTQDLAVSTASPDDLLAGFLTINGELRRQNNDAIKALAKKSQTDMLWKDAFSQMGSSAVQSRFADYRTYFFKGKEIDRQVHLGFDLASTAHAPVLAANRGTVVFASFLGIYGNCVVIDHGLGVQSLYAHLSTLAVKEGDSVEKGHELGRTGITGLAGGDHLHFTLLVDGTAVNPVEWWDAHWLEDRVYRKIREAGGTEQ